MTFRPDDTFQPFLFEDLDIRGAIVRLGPVWRAMQAGRDYPAPVRTMLGELAAVSVLIGANLKQTGRLTFQLKGEGPVNMLVMDCDEQLRLRGMARCAQDVTEAPVPDLLGEGRLLLTLDAAGLATPYQSVVPLTGDSIGTIFEHYLDRSEQQPTRLFLASDRDSAAGLFLQRLPDAERLDPDGWDRMRILADTITREELLLEPTPRLLTRVFPEEAIRLFNPRPVAYHCPEDWEKVRGMLQTLGRAECMAVLEEQGYITVHDDICNHVYRFEAADVHALFEPRVLH